MTRRNMVAIIEEMIFDYEADKGLRDPEWLATRILTKMQDLGMLHAWESEQ